MPLVTLQPVGADDDEWSALEELMQPLSRRLGLRLRLSRTDGDVLMVVGRAVPQPGASAVPDAMGALADDRPVIRYSRPDGPATTPRDPQQLLLQQLRALKLVRHRSPRWQASGWEDDDGGRESVPSLPAEARAADEVQAEALPLDPEQLGMALHLLRGLLDPELPALEASYGPSANLRLDFTNQVAMLDPQAQQQLRVHRRLPRPRAGAVPAIEGAICRDLEETAWDFGVACAGFRLLGADGDCWNRPLRVPVAADHGQPDAFERVVRRCSSLPRHRALARHLVDWPEPTVTPAALAAASGMAPAEVRRFLQGCLFIGRLSWA